MRKMLRPYQARLLTDACRYTGDFLVEQPTGSGKTMQIVTFVAMHLGRRFTHAVVAAPQEQIEHGFVHRDYQTVAFPDCPAVAVNAIAVPEDLLLGARRSTLGSVRRLLAYLRLGGSPDHALACTHAAVNRLTRQKLPDDLSGKALFVDEAHHASADALSQVISVWRERGGQLYFFTATPYRADGRPVALDNMQVFRRSLAEHMADGFAPRHLESAIVALGKPGETVTGGQFTGEEAPPPSYYVGLVAAIIKQWVEDGRPKAIVRVPPMRGGSGGLVARLKLTLEAEGARVLDATGTAVSDKKRFLKALEQEKNKSHGESHYDVMLGIQRVLEGTNWPVCSAVYCVGMPGSLNTVVQLLGRAMRPKGADYPAKHRDRARLVFFVPCSGGEALKELSIDHSRHALLTCCFLADHEVGQEWIVLREVRRGIEDALGPPATTPAAADAENAADRPLDPEVRAEVELTLAAAREEMVAGGTEPALGEVVRIAMQRRGDLPESAFQRVAAELLAAEAGPAGKAARQAIRNEVANRLRIEPRVKKAMEAAFAAVLTEFRTATFQDSLALASVGRQIHGVTGGQMREFAQRLRDAAPRPLTEEMILAWADEHHRMTGEWPSQDSGVVQNAPNETWCGLNLALVRGYRGLPGSSSLAQLLAQHRGVRNFADLTLLTIQRVLELAEAHHQHTGQWPNPNSGPVFGDSGGTWRGIDQALRKGHRGLSGGSSLSDLLKERRGVTNRKNQPRLSEPLIVSLAKAHYQKNGSWPRTDSGPIDELPGTTWRGVESALRMGARGLPGRSSLAQLLQEHCGVRNQSDLPKLAETKILEWADEHKRHTGKFPGVHSGAILGHPAETWAGVNAALKDGFRGLRGGSSLFALLAEYRGLRRNRNAPKLSESTIWEWMTAYFQSWKKWPTDRSGTIQQTTGETWAGVDLALRHGHRGLPGGSSLAKLRNECLIGNDVT